MAKNKKNNKWLFLTILILIIVVAILALVFSQTSKTGEATKALNKNRSGSLQDDISLQQRTIRFSYLNSGQEMYETYENLSIKTYNPYYKDKLLSYTLSNSFSSTSAYTQSSLTPLDNNVYYGNLETSSYLEAHTDYLSYFGHARVLVDQGAEEYYIQEIFNPNGFGFNKIQNINPSCKGAEITFKGLDDVNGSWQPILIIFNLADNSGQSISYNYFYNYSSFGANGDYHTFFEEYPEEIMKYLSYGREYLLTVVVYIPTVHNNLSSGYYQTNISCPDGISNLIPVRKTLTDEEMADIIKKYPYKEK